MKPGEIENREVEAIQKAWPGEDYTHDTTGNITGIADSRYGQSTFQYDALQRLVAAMRPPTAPVPGERYTYDPVGNRVSSHLSAAYAHNAANRLLEDEQCTYEYDLNGNLLEVMHRRPNGSMVTAHRPRLSWPRAQAPPHATGGPAAQVAQRPAPRAAGGPPQHGQEHPL